MLLTVCSPAYPFFFYSTLLPLKQERGQKNWVVFIHDFRILLFKKKKKTMFLLKNKTKVVLLNFCKPGFLKLSAVDSWLGDSVIGVEGRPVHCGYLAASLACTK